MSLIWVTWDGGYGNGSSNPSGPINELLENYRQLPRHIARKHLMAAMRRVIRDGVPILRQYTPPLGTRRGRRKKGEKARSTGELRRSVTVRTGQKGANNAYGSYVYGVLGYRYGAASMKAIFLERGTTHGIRAQRMVEKATAAFGKPSAAKLQNELALALDKAANERAGGHNPGYGG